MAWPVKGAVAKGGVGGVFASGCLHNDFTTPLQLQVGKCERKKNGSSHFTRDETRQDVTRGARTRFCCET